MNKNWTALQEEGDKKIRKRKGYDKPQVLGWMEAGREVDAGGGGKLRQKDIQDMLGEKPMGHPDMGSGAGLGMHLCDVCTAVVGARGGGECLERKRALTQPQEYWRLRSR